MDAPRGYRDGYGKPRRLTTSSGTITIRRLKAVWAEEFAAWNGRSRESREVVYVWADGIYVKAGLERVMRPQESPFASVRLRRTGAAKRYKQVEHATALIWKLLTVAERRFRKLDAPHQLKDVLEGRKFEDGNPVSDRQRKEAA